MITTTTAAMEAEPPAQPISRSEPTIHGPIRIWLDRTLAASQSHHGDGIRSNIAKLSPATLLSLLANSDANLQDPMAVFQQLEDKLGVQPWITDARQQISPKTTWQQVKDAVQTASMLINVAHGIPGLIQSVSQALLPLLSASGEVDGIASSLCPTAPPPQPIST
jgi:hypothetical protein